MRWAYGVTTVPERKSTLLPRTLRSLRLGGWDSPRLFVDNCPAARANEYVTQFGLEVTSRWPHIRTFANYMLALGELYLRDPLADRYAMFQDDLVCYRNLRQYLERWYPERGYLNCLTFPSNESYAKGPGWFESRPLNSGPSGWQTGRGAVALVFSNEAVRVLLSHTHIIERPRDAHAGWKRVDGGIVTAMNKAGWREWVHMPSLVQHIGAHSTMGNKPHPPSDTFMGEEVDAMQLLTVNT
jgi:hypothetical protein